MKGGPLVDTGFVAELQYILHGYLVGDVRYENLDALRLGSVSDFPR